MMLEDFLATPPPRWLRRTHYAASTMMVSLIGLAAILKVDMIVAGTGRVTTDTPTVVVQPMQLSVVREIRVKPGDAVRRGEVLVTLDPTFAQADQVMLTAQRDALAIRHARLQAELDQAPFQPGSDTAEQRLELTLFRQRSAQYDAKLAAFADRAATWRSDVSAAEMNEASLKQQLAVARELEAMRASLLQSQSGSRLNYLEARAARMRTERELRAAETMVAETGQSFRSLETDRRAFIDAWRREILEALVKSHTELAAADEALTKAKRLADMVMLRAPVDGVVLDVSKRSIGSVLREAEPLVTIVPSDAALIADVSIGSTDIGYVRTGDSAVVKIDAFPFQRHGTLIGRLRSVGEESFAQGAASYHRALVTLEGRGLHGLPDGTRLIPGMTVTAEMHVGTRSVLSYFLYPIMRAWQESIREP